MSLDSTGRVKAGSWAHVTFRHCPGRKSWRFGILAPARLVLCPLFINIPLTALAPLEVYIYPELPRPCHDLLRITYSSYRYLGRQNRPQDELSLPYPIPVLCPGCGRDGPRCRGDSHHQRCLPRQREQLV